MAGFTNPLMNHPLMNNPLTNPLSGGFDFVKSLWGGMPSAVPGFVVPTVDLEELDKRITDLKAVESWLAINSNMLRATIQSLEVQRNTIATIQSIGGSFSGVGGAGAGGVRPKPGETPSSYSNWPNPPTSKPAAGANPQGKGGSQPSGNPSAPRTAAPRKKPSAPAPEPAGLTPAAWLGFLQDQFNQVAQAALAVPPQAGEKARGSAASKAAKSGPSSATRSEVTAAVPSDKRATPRARKAAK
jgi:hypothetical protein